MKRVRTGIELFIVLDVVLKLNFKRTKILRLFSQDRVRSILQGKKLGLFLYFSLIERRNRYKKIDFEKSTIKLITNRSPGSFSS